MSFFRKIGLVGLTFLLDAVFFSRIEIFGGTVDFALAVVVVVAMVEGSFYATTFALLIGIMEDLVFARYFGVRSLGLFLLAYTTAETSKKMLDLTPAKVWIRIALGYFLVRFSVYMLNVYLGIYFSMRGFSVTSALWSACLTGFSGLLFYLLFARGKRRKIYYGF